MRIREGFPEDAPPGGHYIDCANELLARMLRCTQMSPSVKPIDLKEAFYLFVYCLFELVDEILLLLAYRELKKIEEERKNKR